MSYIVGLSVISFFSFTKNSDTIGGYNYFDGKKNEPIPDSTYTINVELVDVYSPKNEFKIVDLRNFNDLNSRNLSITDTSNTQLKTGGGKTSVTHTSTGNYITSWNFDWTTPINEEDDITFYLASNVSNNNGVTSAYEIHLKELVIQEDAFRAVIEQDAIINIDNNLKIVNKYNFITTKLSVQGANDILIFVLSLNGKIGDDLISRNILI